MKFLFVMMLMFGHSVFASDAGYNLKMVLSSDEKILTSPRIITKSGEKATITEKNGTSEIAIDVVASEGKVQGHKGIMMKFNISIVGKNGERKIVSKPQILAKENEKAEIIINDNKENKLSLSVIANRM